MILQSQLQIINKEPLQITRNGFALCSLRNPEREAMLWLQQWDKYLADELEVVVLGLGAGHHVQQLAQNFNDILIHVVEPDSNLIELYKKQNITLPNINLMNDKFIPEHFQLLPILDFRPSWQGFVSVYQNILTSLRGENNNIKEICQSLSAQDQSQEAKICRALRELVV